MFVVVFNIMAISIDSVSNFCMATLNSEWQSEFRKIVNFKLWKSFFLIKIILLSHSFLIWKKKTDKSSSELACSWHLGCHCQMVTEIQRAAYVMYTFTDKLLMCDYMFLWNFREMRFINSSLLSTYGDLQYFKDFIAGPWPLKNLL